MEYRIEQTEISGKEISIKIPTGMEFKEAYYVELDAGSLIHLNLEEELATKLTAPQLAKIFEAQAQFMEQKHNNREEFVHLDEENQQYLLNQSQLMGLSLSAEDIVTVIDKEILYLKMINVVE